MKRYITLLVVLLFFAGCKKENETPSDNSIRSYCSNAQFQLLINEVMLPLDLTEDHDGNIIVLGSKDHKVQVLKLDTLGKIIWKIERPDAGELGQKVICLSDNSIIIALDGKSESTKVDYGLHNIWYQIGYSDSDCSPRFSFGICPIGYSVTNKNYLCKYNKDGNLLWEKEFSGMYGGGNSLLNYSDNSLLYLTIDLKGDAPVLVRDSNSVFQDTVLFPKDLNIISFMKMDYDGNILFQQAINNVYNIESYRPSPLIDILKLNNQFVIKSKNEMICLDQSGQVVDRYEPIPQFCNNTLYNMVGDAGTMIISGSYLHNDSLWGNHNFYIEKRDFNNTTIWHLDERLDRIYDYRNDRFIGSVTNYRPGINMYDKSGNLLWSLPNTYDASRCCMINCINGVTDVRGDAQGIIVTRTDEYGNFE